MESQGGSYMKQATYLCIDLKSFYASVECVERGLDPFEVNLVVADPSRGDGAITLAATPHIKALGVKSRGRIFEIPKHIEYMTATPRMHLYMEYSAWIYKIMLKYISKDDIHPYSVDESFLDVTSYLSLYQMDAKTLAEMILKDIFDTTGITATVGIGTNLYLAKIAMDIVAKHNKSHVAYLDEEMYRQLLWKHQPLSDFWMVGSGTIRRLARYNIFDMEGIARSPRKLMEKEFGVNGDYLYDHAWGKEPTTMEEIKAYKSKAHSVSNSQILFEDYNYEDALLVLKEMVETNVLNLTDRHIVTDHISLSIGYSKNVRRATGGSQKITNCTNCYSILVSAFERLYRRTTDPRYSIRSISISFSAKDEGYEFYDLFTDIEAIKKEKQIQKTLVSIKDKYGKNAILKGMNLEKNATQRKRNTLIGGHNAY